MPSFVSLPLRLEGDRRHRRRIAELENELAVTRQAIELLKAKVVSPKDASLRFLSVGMPNRFEGGGVVPEIPGPVRRSERISLR